MSALKQILLFNENEPSSSANDIIIYTCVILIISPIIFMGLMKAFNISDINSAIDKEKTDVYAQWAEKNITPGFVLFSNLINSVFYAPLAEEMFFRFFILKVILVKTLKMNNNIAILLQGILFGIIHCSNAVFTAQSVKFSNIQALSAGITGIVSGWVYIKTNSLVSSLLAHIINNFMAGMTETISYAKYLNTYIKK